MRCFKYALLVLLFCSFVAEAALVRGAGRGSETSTSPQSYGLYDNSYLSTGYLVQGAPVINNVNFTSGDIPLLAVPRDCWLIVNGNIRSARKIAAVRARSVQLRAASS